ncbi:c-type cytochrome [Xanthobacter sediminis]
MMRFFPSALLAASVLAAALPGAARAGDPQTVYALHCAGCHQADGRGDHRAGVPPFPGVVDQVLRQPDGRLFLTQAPGLLSAGLPVETEAELLNWIVATFAPETARQVPAFTAAEIADLRRRPVADFSGLRREIAAEIARRGGDIGSYE